MRLVEAGKLDLGCGRVRVAQLAAAPPGVSGPDDHVAPAAVAPLQPHRCRRLLRRAAGRARARHPRRSAPGTPIPHPAASSATPTLAAAVMEAATGQRFDRLIDALVLRPLGIAACFNWETCSQATAARAVVLYDADGQPVHDNHHGRKPECSVSPAPRSRPAPAIATCRAGDPASTARCSRRRAGCGFRPTAWPGSAAGCSTMAASTACACCSRHRCRRWCNRCGPTHPATA